MFDNLKELSLDERMKILRTANQTEEGATYYRQLTEQDLAERRTVLGENLIEIDKLEDAKKEFMATYKEQVSPFKIRNKELLKDIKFEQAEHVGNLYHFYDFEEGLRISYNEQGDLVKSRRLKPTERTTVLPFTRTGTND